MPTESGSDGAAHTVVLDVDGTLVDSNYQHSVAWFRAFRRHGVTPSVWRIHRAIGMGGDRLVAAVAGDEVESRCGDEVRAAWEQEYAPYLPEVCALDGARLLLERLHEHGCTVVLASSGKPDHIEHYLDLLDARRLADTWTTAQDAEQTKPAPDLLTAALERVEVRGRPLLAGSVLGSSMCLGLELRIGVRRQHGLQLKSACVSPSAGGSRCCYAATNLYYGK